MGAKGKQTRRNAEKNAKMKEEEEEEEEIGRADDSSSSSDSGDDSSSSSDSGDDKNEESSSEEDDGRKAKFSDEHVNKWLKPKTKKKDMLSSSDDDDGEDVDEKDVDDDDDDDDDDLLEIEKQSRLVDEEIEAERLEAQEEMRETIGKHTSIYHLPTREELEDENSDRVVPPQELKQHIESILEVLADFKSRREAHRARNEYIDQLGYFLSELYGYLPELVDYFLSMFSPTEAVEFLSASDKPRPLVIRTNTLKMRRKDLAASLMKRGVTLDPLAEWSKVGLKIIESPVPIGATPEYLSGAYMLQSAASMCPILALAPQPKEKVLDMSAAPGGKTSYLAQLMRNTGSIVANDLKPDRQKATVANMHRLGVKNVMTCTHDGRQLGKMFSKRFDRILLDAPCSGLGVISRDPSVKVQRTIEDVNKCSHLQKELLLSAIDALNHKSKSSGGVMVYSTCSVSVAENEEVVQYALTKRDIKIVDSGLDFGKSGFTRYQQKRFHPSVALCRRFYPHVHNMDGFFVAKIQKLSDGEPKGRKDPKAEEGEEPIKNEITTTNTAVDDDKKKTKKSAMNQDSKHHKKRKKATTDEDAIEGKRSKKNQKYSVPPPRQKTQPKKQRTNAKVTKPRRKKPATDI